MIKIPELQEFGDTENCNICLENVSDNKHITECGHLYHQSCLFNYLETKNKIKESSCDDRCGCKKTPIIIYPFECPVCKTNI